MKLRTGFVSNSSSSSFILQFDKPLTKFEDLFPVLDPNGTGFVSVSGYDSVTYDTIQKQEQLKEVAQAVYDGIITTPLSKEDILKILDEEFDEYQIKGKKEREKYDKARRMAWWGRHEFFEDLFKKYGIRTDREANNLTEEKRQLFVIEYSNLQVDFAGEQAKAEQVLKEIKDKHVPKIFEGFYDPTKTYYSADYSDDSGDPYGSWAEHEGLSEQKVAHFNHH